MRLASQNRTSLLAGLLATLGVAVLIGWEFHKELQKIEPGSIDTIHGAVALQLEIIFSFVLSPEGAIAFVALLAAMQLLSPGFPLTLIRAP